MQLTGTKHYPVRILSDGMDDFAMDERILKTIQGVAGIQCRNDKIERISQLLLQNRHLSLRMLADEVNIDKDREIVADLRKRKICALFYFLTSKQKDQRTAACRDLIATADNDPDFFKIKTRDETLCFAYDPTNKRQFAAWVG
jgi:hypothetical protein